MKTKISVIGAGFAGCALAGSIALKGYPVTLYAHSQHFKKASEIINHGGITLSGVVNGFSKLAQITSEIEKATSQADIIFFMTPSYAQNELFQDMCPYLKDNQIVVFIPGNFASLSALHILHEKHLDHKNIALAEMTSVPYSCRSVENGHVHILGIKQNIDIGIHPLKMKNEVMNKLEGILDSQLTLQPNILYIGFNSPNGVVHPAAAVLNTGWIESTQGDFYFYRQGMSPSVSKVLEQIDQDRIRIGQQFGLKLKTLLEIANEFYGVKFDTIRKFAENSKLHNSVKACPVNIQDRYFSEDVPYILVPWYAFGTLVGFCSSVIESVIKLTSIMHNIDYFKMGRNLENMGLQEKNVDGIMNYV